VTEAYVPTVRQRDFEERWAKFQEVLRLTPDAALVFLADPTVIPKLRALLEQFHRDGFFAGAQFAHGSMSDGMVDVAKQVAGRLLLESRSR
jgi:hypothetical protein